MVKAFQCLYFLTKRNIPHTTNFEPLLDLLTDLGLDVKSKLCQGENAKYTSNTSIKEFLLALSDIVEMEILSELRQAKYYSLMFDETTDISTIEQMVIHARYVDENGKVVTKFLKILDCLDPQLDGNDGDVTISLNATQIADTVANFIDEKQLPYDKLVGLDTDGAPVMVGSKNGAVKKIVEIQEDQTNGAKRM